MGWSGPEAILGQFAFLIIIRDPQVITLFILPRPLSLTEVGIGPWLSGGRVQQSYVI